MLERCKYYSTCAYTYTHTYIHTYTCTLHIYTCTYIHTCTGCTSASALKLCLSATVEFRHGKSMYMHVFMRKSMYIHVVMCKCVVTCKCMYMYATLIQWKVAMAQEYIRMCLYEKVVVFVFVCKLMYVCR